MARTATAIRETRREVSAPAGQSFAQFCRAQQKRMQWQCKAMERRIQRRTEALEPVEGMESIGLRQPWDCDTASQQRWREDR